MIDRDDEIRRVLRAADPAASRDVSAAERLRMRAVVTSAARRSRRPRSYARLLIVGGAVAAAAVLFIAFLPHGDRGGARIAARPAQEAPEASAYPAREAAPPEPVLAKLPARAKPAHARARLARLDDEGRITRIVFTGPEGTKILWFVGSPDAKELGS